MNIDPEAYDVNTLAIAHTTHGNTARCITISTTRCVLINACKNEFEGGRKSNTYISRFRSLVQAARPHACCWSPTLRTSAEARRRRAARRCEETAFRCSHGEILEAGIGIAFHVPQAPALFEQKLPRSLVFGKHPRY